MSTNSSSLRKMGGPSPRKIIRAEESGASEDESREFDEETSAALEEIDTCQNEIDALNEQASVEILQVEQKYNQLRKPSFDKRGELIKKIPNFWVVAMVNHPQISLVIDEDEEDCLHFLSKLEVEEFEDIKSGYRLSLHFDENPFFENTVLTKEFLLGPNGEPKSTSSEIRWKENMDLSKKQREVLSLRRKRGLEPKTFFSWLNDHQDPACDDIAEVIKDDLWPNPLQYYLVPDLDGENGTEEEISSEEEEEEEDGEEEQDDKTNAKGAADGAVEEEPKQT